MSITVHKTTFPGHADGCQDIVSCDHDGANVGCKELFQNIGRGGLELVLKDDEPNEIEIALHISSAHLLYFDPAEFFQMSRRASDNSISFVRVEG